MKGIEIEKYPEFDNHKLVTFVYDEKSDLRGFIAIHRGGLVNPALGATRVWEYESESEALRDSLRLSRMMSYKSALAGLKYGGAKAALLKSSKSTKSRKSFFKAYADRVNYLGGRFITGTDVGVSDDDISLMRKETPYVIGSKVDPAYFTAIGVLHGIQASLKEKFGKETIKGREFAIQGLGKTGSNILSLLYKDAKTIFVSDIDKKRMKEIKKKFPKVKPIAISNIHKQPVDVFVPCALSGALNTKTVSELDCEIVAGSANNQLKEDTIGKLLYQLDILYAPDYVINAGGLISVVEEMERETPKEKDILKKTMRIKKTLKIIFAKSKKQGKGTNFVANEMAERISNNRA